MRAGVAGPGIRTRAAWLYPREPDPDTAWREWRGADMFAPESEQLAATAPLSEDRRTRIVG